MNNCLSWWSHLIRAPRRVGSILPSSPSLANHIAARAAAFVHRSDHLRLIEVGAGTGAITGALVRLVPASALTLVEADPACCGELRRRFPQAEVTQGLIEDVVEELMSPCPRLIIVSSVPLFSLTDVSRDQVLSAYETLATAASLCRIIQYTYAPWLPGCRARQLCGQTVSSVWRNIPPAWVWSATHSRSHPLREEVNVSWAPRRAVF